MSGACGGTGALSREGRARAPGWTPVVRRRQLTLHSTGVLLDTGFNKLKRKRQQWADWDLGTLRDKKVVFNIHTQNERLDDVLGLMSTNTSRTLAAAGASYRDRTPNMATNKRVGSTLVAFPHILCHVSGFFLFDIPQPKL